MGVRGDGDVGADVGVVAAVDAGVDGAVRGYSIDRDKGCGVARGGPRLRLTLCARGRVGVGGGGMTLVGAGAAADVGADESDGAAGGDLSVRGKV